MKVFISWSGFGTSSQLVANLLNEWLPKVTESVQPWISTHDIASGSQWFQEITQNLEATTQGIFCLTKENKNKPWILFEAGALAKGSQQSRVYTFLIDLQTGDVEAPLAQFNHTLPTDKSSVLALVKTINASVIASGEQGFRESVLMTVFEANWPEFETAFRQILAAASAGESATPRRDIYEILNEVLESVRGIDKRVTAIEGFLSNKNENINQSNKFSMNNSVHSMESKTRVYNTDYIEYLNQIYDSLSIGSLPPSEAEKQFIKAALENERIFVGQGKPIVINHFLLKLMTVYKNRSGRDLTYQEAQDYVSTLGLGPFTATA